MKKISLNNGRTTKDVSELTDNEIKTVIEFIENGYGYEEEIVENAYASLGENPTIREWLTEYMDELAYDIIIG